jgi:hypothetical protein
MNDRKREKPPRDPDAEAIEREIRSRREFNLGEALGRADGCGHLAGGSPISPLEQAETSALQFVAAHLDDPDGALAAVLARTIRSDGPTVARHIDRPLAGLVAVIDRLLARESWLADFVRDVDAEWGRRYQTRPHFDRPGEPSDPLDPYTIDSVRDALRRLANAARRRDAD